MALSGFAAAVVANRFLGSVQHARISGMNPRYCLMVSAVSFMSCSNVAGLDRRVFRWRRKAIHALVACGDQVCSLLSTTLCSVAVFGRCLRRNCSSLR
jgi:hypothetical protein